MKLFANPLVIILVLASAISMMLGDTAGGIIIIAIVLLSVFLNFFMEHQARRAVDEITKKVATTAAVMRDGAEREIPIAQVVRGDIIKLRAGDLVPACASVERERPAGARVCADRRIPSSGEGGT